MALRVKLLLITYSLVPGGRASDYVQVGRLCYLRTAPGDSVVVAVHAGRLGISWFRVEE